MASFAAVALSLLAGQAAAKVCTNLTIPVNVNARQGLYQPLEVETNLDATEFALNSTNIGRNFTADILVGFQNRAGQYNISAKYCRPDGDNSTSQTIQFLTHGIGFDKTYWDLSYNDYNYSYTNVAVDEYGFHTIAIDRLGIGNSSHGEPLNEIQAPLEVSSIYVITQMLRNGSVQGIPRSFQSVVHVGHSFGAAQSYALSSLYPNASDALILTGWTVNNTWLPRTLAGWNVHQARLNQPLRFGNVSAAAVQQALSAILGGRVGNGRGRGRPGKANLSLPDISSFIQSNFIQSLGLSPSDLFEIIATTEVGDLIAGYNSTPPTIPGDYPTGYLSWSDLTSNIYAFQYPRNIDPALSILSERTKQPVTLGEIITLPLVPMMSSFSGPVQVLNGRFDNIYCGGDCLATGDPAVPNIASSLAMRLPNASSFDNYIHPNTAHGINFHYNSTAAYRIIQDFLVDQGLQSQ